MYTVCYSQLKIISAAGAFNFLQKPHSLYFKDFTLVNNFVSQGNAILEAKEPDI